MAALTGPMPVTNVGMPALTSRRASKSVAVQARIMGSDPLFSCSVQVFCSAILADRLDRAAFERVPALFFFFRVIGLL